AARDRHRRRPHLQPNAYALHNAGGLSLPRSSTLAVSKSESAPTAGGCRDGTLIMMRQKSMRTPSETRVLRALALALCAFAIATVAACTVGPNYVRPTAEVSPGYKELDGWK